MLNGFQIKMNSKNNKEENYIKELKRKRKNKNRKVKEEYAKLSYNSSRSIEDFDESFDWDEAGFEKFTKNGKR
jgi:hypothetical protein